MIDPRINYILTHEPTLYFLKRRLWFFWTIENQTGEILLVPSINKARVKVFCDLLNSVYRYGYLKGSGDMQAVYVDILKEIFER